MSTRRAGAGVTVAVLAASLSACGSAADPTRDGRSAVEQARAVDTGPLSTAGARLAALRRPRTADDRWPTSTTDNRPGDGLVVDRGAGRRLFAAGSPPYGLWLVPGRPDRGGTVPTSGSMPDVCLRVIPLTGPDRGGGASSCANAETLARDGKLVVIVMSDAKARRMVVAGTVPDGVRTVRLVATRTGDVERRPINDNAFLFETTRKPMQLRYRGPDGPVTHPLDF